MQTKKRKMKAGEALVGMKRSGSQLREKKKKICQLVCFVGESLFVVGFGSG